MSKFGDGPSSWGRPVHSPRQGEDKIAQVTRPPFVQSRYPIVSPHESFPEAKEPIVQDKPAPRIGSEGVYESYAVRRPSREAIARLRGRFDLKGRLGRAPEAAVASLDDDHSGDEARHVHQAPREPQEIQVEAPAAETKPSVSSQRGYAQVVPEERAQIVRERDIRAVTGGSDNDEIKEAQHSEHQERARQERPAEPAREGAQPPQPPRRGGRTLHGEAGGEDGDSTPEYAENENDPAEELHRKLIDDLSEVLDIEAGVTEIVGREAVEDTRFAPQDIETGESPVDAVLAAHEAEAIAQQAEEAEAVKRFNELSPEQQSMAIQAILAETKEVHYDPEANKPFKDKLANVYTLGDQLVRTHPDLDEPAFGSRENSPREYTIECSQEAIAASDLGSHILSVEVTARDEYEFNERHYDNSLIFRVKSEHSNPNVTPFRLNEDVSSGWDEMHEGKADIYPSGEEGTVIVTRIIEIFEPSSRPPEVASVFEDFSTWPLHVGSMYEDLQGHDVLPPSNIQPDVLHAGRHYGGVDINGCDVLMKLLNEESKIRQGNTQ